MAVGIGLGDDGGGAGDGFVEERFQAGGGTFAGLERLSIGAHDGAELDVLKLDVLVAPAAGDGKELVKVLALAVIDDVQNRIRMPRFVAELDRGEVAG